MLEYLFYIFLLEIFSAGLLSFGFHFLAELSVSLCAHCQHKAIYKRNNKRRILLWISIEELVVSILLSLEIFPIFYKSDEKSKLYDILSKNKFDILYFLKFIIIYILTVTIIYYRSFYYDLFNGIKAFIFTFNLKNVEIQLSALINVINSFRLVSLITVVVIALIIYFAFQKKKLFLSVISQLQNEEFIEITTIHKKLYKPLSELIYKNCDTIDKILDSCENDMWVSPKEKYCWIAEMRFENQFPGISICNGKVKSKIPRSNWNKPISNLYKDANHEIDTICTLLNSFNNYYSLNVVHSLNKNLILPRSIYLKDKSRMQNTFITKPFVEEFINVDSENIKLDDLNDHALNEILERYHSIYSYFEDKLIENIRVLRQLIKYQNAFEKSFSINHQNLCDTIMNFIFSVKNKVLGN